MRVKRAVRKEKREADVRWGRMVSENFESNKRMLSESEKVSQVGLIE